MPFQHLARHLSVSRLIGADQAYGFSKEVWNRSADKQEGANHDENQKIGRTAKAVAGSGRQSFLATGGDSYCTFRS